ncbi:taste receptor type 2 member 4 [Phyllostomus hastatus]|uniref:taste receptor type 2 member 4 n=1 Tax=Phyllostomus hastatus TaxID=9423 RepID=UPI001E681947|nr:taste receptor type 2 member 4 [Phyllostomus hastatus]
MVPEILFVVIVSATLNFVGLIMNLFIAVVSCQTWVKRHQISSSEKILFSLGTARCLTLSLSLLSILYLFISPRVGRSASLFAVMLCWVFLDSSSLWFVTMLNVLYCVKITNLQHSVFLLLRQNISSKTPRLLVACVLVSAFTTLLYAVLRQTLRFPEYVTRRNGTDFSVNERILSLAISLFLSSFLQFLINVTSASLLINSLRRHIQTMQRSASGFWNPQTEAHVGAMKLMAYSLLLYIPYSVAALSLHLPSSVGMNLGTRSVCVLLSAVYHPGHSVLITVTHPKLKTKAKKILCFNKWWNISRE